MKCTETELEVFIRHFQRLNGRSVYIFFNLVSVTRPTMGFFLLKKYAVRQMFLFKQLMNVFSGITKTTINQYRIGWNEMLICYECKLWRFLKYVFFSSREERRGEKRANVLFCYFCEIVFYSIYCQQCNSCGISV